MRVDYMLAAQVSWYQQDDATIPGMQYTAELSSWEILLFMGNNLREKPVSQVLPKTISCIILIENTIC
jgi:hypothetical protein